MSVKMLCLVYFMIFTSKSIAQMIKPFQYDITRGDRLKGTQEIISDSVKEEDITVNNFPKLTLSLSKAISGSLSHSGSHNANIKHDSSLLPEGNLNFNVNNSKHGLDKNARVQISGGHFPNSVKIDDEELKNSGNFKKGSSHSITGGVSDFDIHGSKPSGLHLDGVHSQSNINGGNLNIKRSKESGDSQNKNNHSFNGELSKGFGSNGSKNSGLQLGGNYSGSLENDSLKKSKDSGDFKKESNHLFNGDLDKGFGYHGSTDTDLQVNGGHFQNNGIYHDKKSKGSGSSHSITGGLGDSGIHGFKTSGLHLGSSHSQNNGKLGNEGSKDLWDFEKESSHSLNKERDSSSGVNGSKNSGSHLNGGHSNNNEADKSLNIQDSKEVNSNSEKENDHLNSNHKHKHDKKFSSSDEKGSNSIHGSTSSDNDKSSGSLLSYAFNDFTSGIKNAVGDLKDVVTDAKDAAVSAGKSEISKIGSTLFKDATKVVDGFISSTVNDSSSANGNCNDKGLNTPNNSYNKSHSFKGKKEKNFSHTQGSHGGIHFGFGTGLVNTPLERIKREVNSSNFSDNEPEVNNIKVQSKSHTYFSGAIKSYASQIINIFNGLLKSCSPGENCPFSLREKVTNFINGIRNTVGNFILKLKSIIFGDNRQVIEPYED